MSKATELKKILSRIKSMPTQSKAYFLGLSIERKSPDWQLQKNLWLRLWIEGYCFPSWPHLLGIVDISKKQSV